MQSQITADKHPKSDAVNVEHSDGAGGEKIRSRHSIQRQRGEGREKKEKKRKHVVSTDAIIDIGTVVVKYFHTSIASAAVL